MKKTRVRRSLNSSLKTHLDRNSLPRFKEKTGPSAKELEEVKSLNKKEDKIAVIEIRRAIRANFSDIPDRVALFKDWDMNDEGIIRAQNLQSILEQTGMKAEIRHVNMLISCINGLDCLTFADLKVLLENEREELSFPTAEKPCFMKFPRKFVRESPYRERSSINLLKNYLCNHRSVLFEQFSKADALGSGRIPYEEFLKVMNNMSIPYQFINGKLIRSLFFALGGDNYGIDYINFFHKIEKTSPYSFEQFCKSLFLEENLERNAKSVNELIQTLFNSKEQLRETLNKEFRRSVKRLSLRKFLVNRGMSKYKVDSFLETIHWNTNDDVLIDDLAELVFKVPLPLIKRKEPPRQINHFPYFLEDVQEKIVKEFGCKEFDLNNDGFVSARDVRNTLKKHRVFFLDNDIKMLMKDRPIVSLGRLSRKLIRKNLSM